ncbi:MAG: GGDEF domain-containing protein [Cyanobacteria bacterium SZAS LIN-2]|nr:GGDEF domain-containing protein [Cyanobacteria bacterium SZAS LIN-2]
MPDANQRETAMPAPAAATTHYRPLDRPLPHESRALAGRDFLCLPQDFFQSALHTAVQTPINSVTQMVAARYLPSVQIIDAPEKVPEMSPRWHAQQLGAGLGAAADIGLMEIASRGTLPPQVIGACYDGLLRPVEQDGKELKPVEQVQERLKNAAIGSLGLATWGVTNKGLTRLAENHIPWKSISASKEITNTLCGTLAGIPAGLMTTSLSGGESLHDLAIGTYTSAIGGLGLGAIHAGIERQAAVKKQAAEFERLQEQAVTDHLTGLQNRRGIDQALNREFQHSIRSGKPLSIIYGDLDGFKKLNDNLGHEKGDQALSIVSRQIKQNIRAYDHAGRSGGDEFTIILPETDAATARNMADRLQEAVQLRYSDAAGREFPVGISLGVVTRSSGESSPADLQKRADAEMYRAKQARKGLI